MKSTIAIAALIGAAFAASSAFARSSGPGWLATNRDKAGGGMSQNPPDEPGGFPTQTCTIY